MIVCKCAGLAVKYGDNCVGTISRKGKTGEAKRLVSKNKNKRVCEVWKKYEFKIARKRNLKNRKVDFKR